MASPGRPRRGSAVRGVAVPAGLEAPGSERIVVALVRGLHGLNGMVRVEVLTDRPEERFAVGSVLHPEGSTTPLTVASAAPVEDGPGWRLRFAERPDRAAVESLRNVYLEAPVVRDAALAEGEYFWHEVVGAAVFDADGQELGRVRDVYRAGAAEVYVVAGGPPGEFDVPGVAAFIREFDPRGGRIVVDAEALALDEVAPRLERPRRRDRRGQPGPGRAAREARAAAAVDGSGDGESGGGESAAGEPATGAAPGEAPANTDLPGPNDGAGSGTTP